jgi:Uma2 family endonuclease
MRLPFWSRSHEKDDFLADEVIPSGMIDKGANMDLALEYQKLPITIDFYLVLRMVVQLDRKRFTTTDFQQMIDSGILQEGEPYELLNGEIIRKTDYPTYPFSQTTIVGIGKRHAASTKRINAALTQRLNGQAIVGVQDPVHLNDYSEPQPDISVLKLNPDFYSSGHPQSHEIYLIIEVSDTPLEVDRTIKLPLYAQAGILELWIVNLQEEQIEVYRQSMGETYTVKQVFTSGQMLTIASLPDVAIAVDDILS